MRRAFVLALVLVSAAPGLSAAERNGDVPERVNDCETVSVRI